MPPSAIARVYVSGPNPQTRAAGPTLSPSIALCGPLTTPTPAPKKGVCPCCPSRRAASFTDMQAGVARAPFNGGVETRAPLVALRPPAGQCPPPWACGDVGAGRETSRAPPVKLRPQGVPPPPPRQPSPCARAHSGGDDRFGCRQTDGHTPMAVAGPM